MKPIFRWTVGDVSNQGLDILRYSIKKVKQIYDAECIVCYNKIEPSKLQLGSSIKLIDQCQYNFIFGSPIKELWKLVPLRLDITRHEIFIDNDLVIFKNISKINEFIENDTTLLMHGHSRFFGQYDHLIPKNMKINSGLFGIPPNFNFEDQIKKFFLGQWVQNRDIGMFDDQGIITLCLLDYYKTIFITEKEVFNYDVHFRSKEDVPKNIQGLHFINANREPHPGWIKYNSMKLL